MCFKMMEHGGPLCMCLIFATVVGIFVLIATLATVYREYDLAKEFQETRCDVVGKVDHGDQNCKVCSHDSDDDDKADDCYYSSFPCIELKVDYKVKDGDLKHGSLHPSAIQMATYPLCSYNVCERSRSYNKNTVNRYINNWYLRQDVVCFYNPKDYTEVITKIHYTRTEALHSVLWPASFAMLMLVLMGTNFLMRKNNTSLSSVISCCGDCIYGMVTCSCCSCDCDCFQNCCDRQRYRDYTPEVRHSNNEDNGVSSNTRPRAATAPVSPFYGSVSPSSTATSSGPPPMMESLPSSFSDSHPGQCRPGFTPPPSYEQHSDFEKPSVQVQLQPPTPEAVPSGDPESPPPSYREVLQNPVTYSYREQRPSTDLPDTVRSSV